MAGRFPAKRYRSKLERAPKFIYAKQLLKGAAKIFIRSQRRITDWDSLRQALRSEFGAKVSSLEVHRMLRNRCKYNNEDLKEYLYSLMEIGKPIKLDDMSLIEYFIDGIPDSKQNKINLYQAKTVAELKEQICIYEKVRASRQQATTSNPNQLTIRSRIPVNPNARVKETRRCFKCGSTSHLAKDCRGSFKCFRCGQPGHRAADCRSAPAAIKMESHNVNTLGGDMCSRITEAGKCIFVDVKRSHKTFSALVDTGCDLCLIRYDTLLMLDSDIELVADRRRLVGVGNGGLTTLGSFTRAFIIDEMELEITFHVARERDMKYAAVIGNDILKQVTLIVHEDLVEFKPKMKTSEVTRNTAVATIETEPDLWSEFDGLCITTMERSEPELDLSHLSKEKAKLVREWVSSYAPRKIRKTPVEMKILLADETPVYAGPRRMSHADKCIVEEQVATWLREGIIQRSTSEYASPVVLVAKKMAASAFAAITDGLTRR